MTVLEAKQQLATLGMTLRKTVGADEYRVNFRGGIEDTAYYTPDLNDAVETARLMHRQNSSL